jgi:hypothetical protein
MLIVESSLAEYTSKCNITAGNEHLPFLLLSCLLQVCSELPFLD